MFNSYDVIYERSSTCKSLIRFALTLPAFSVATKLVENVSLKVIAATFWGRLGYLKAGVWFFNEKLRWSVLKCVHTLNINVQPCLVGILLTNLFYRILSCKIVQIFIFHIRMSLRFSSLNMCTFVVLPVFSVRREAHENLMWNGKLTVSAASNLIKSFAAFLNIYRRHKLNFTNEISIFHFTASWRILWYRSTYRGIIFNQYR